MPGPRPRQVRARPRANRASGPTKTLFDATVARIAANVRALRVAREWTQEQLAEAANLSTVGVALVEGQRTNVTVATLCQLAGAFDVDPARLLAPRRAKVVR